MMQRQLPSKISSKELSIYLGISERAVRKRAKNGGWPCVYKSVKGGACHQYMLAGLPEDVRAAVTELLQPLPINPAEAAGFERAVEVAEEVRCAEAARRQAKEDGLSAYNLLPEARKKEAEAREAVLSSLNAFLGAVKLSKKKGTALFIREFKAGTIKLPKWVQQCAATRKGKLSLSAASLYRWEKAYAEMGLAGLAGRYSATRKTSIAEHMQRFIEAMIVKKPHVAIPHLVDALSARFDGQAMPSASSVRRYVNKWREENAGLLLYLKNPDEWKNKNMVAFGRADERVTRLNQIWEFDSTPTDVMLADGRHSLIGVLDVYSRRAKLLVSPTSKAAAIAALTRRALIDWGVPEIAKTDNGADYVSEHMTRVFRELEIYQELCPPFTPEAKPHVERFFRTFSHGIVELLPGFIGHNVSDRKDIEARRSFAQRLMKKGETPIDIRMTAEQFQQICDRWCEAMYHNKAHAGIGGATPMEMVRQWMEPVRRIKNESALDILLAPVADGKGRRVIGKNGIKVERDFFIAEELGPHVGEEVFVQLDPVDFGTIHVFKADANGEKKFLCTAYNVNRKGLDRSEVAAKAKAVQKQVMAKERKAANRVVKAAGIDAIDQEILDNYERKFANVREFTKPSEAYTTADLEQAAKAVEQRRDDRMGPKPIEITAEQEAAAAELIDLNHAKRAARPLPATPQEKYEQIDDDLRNGMDVSESDLAWMKKYELWLETGERMVQKEY